MAEDPFTSEVEEEKAATGEVKVGDPHHSKKKKKKKKKRKQKKQLSLVELNRKCSFVEGGNRGKGVGSGGGSVDRRAG